MNPYCKLCNRGFNDEAAATLHKTENRHHQSLLNDISSVVARYLSTIMQEKKLNVDQDERYKH